MYEITEKWNVDTYTKGPNFFLRTHTLLRRVYDVKRMLTTYQVLDRFYTSNFPLDVFTSAMYAVREHQFVGSRVLEFLEQKGPIGV
jgi:hypothetical protein